MLRVFFDFLLPKITRDVDSIFVVIDRLSAHLSPEVAELMIEKGHVLDVLGGGTTSSSHVGDVMRHGHLKAALRDLEYNQYRNDRLAHPERLPLTTRQ